jgi:PhzF family phenazine biosynthesis protein
MMIEAGPMTTLKTPSYIINAFTNRPFSGNPAGVCPLNAWLPDDVMQKIAAENDVSETAFFVKEGDAFRLRWFAPAGEVDLCGHATLASAHVLFNELRFTGASAHFETRSGRLNVRRDGERLLMDFPVLRMDPQETIEDLEDGLDAVIVETWRGMDHVALLESEDAVKNLEPNLARLARLDLRGVVVTAKGKDADYVCRCFAPKFGINEDPVTGSAQCMLAPFWAERLGKTRLTVKQLSKRGGDMIVELKDERVMIAGEARLYFRGEVEI